MSLFAMAVPILPGKTEQWKRFMEQLNGPRRSDYEASRQRLGVHERTFFQSTPQGDLVIVTLEGDNPEAAFGRFVSGDDDFTRWFLQEAKDLHGLDLTQMGAAPMPTLVVDSDRQMQKRAA